MSSQEMMTRPERASATQETRYETIAPICDVWENADEYLISAEMPGVEKQAVDIRLDRTRLSIEAYRHADDAAGEAGQGGRRYVRVFEVPDTIDADQITARLENGVLDVHLPKTPHARVRRIDVTKG